MSTQFERLGVPGGRVQNTILWQDQFTADVAAGSVNGSAAYPGVYNRAATDTNNVMSIADEKLVWNGTCAANNNVRTPTTYTHIGGRATGWVVPTRSSVSVRLWMGMFTGAADLNLLQSGFVYTSATSIRIKNSGTDIYNPLAIGVNEHCFVIVERPSGGAYLFARNGPTGNYKLLWVYPSYTAATLLQVLCENASAQNFEMDNWQQIQLRNSRFTTDWGLCVDYKAIVTTGDTVGSESDGIIEFIWTPVADEVLDLQFRRTDDDNCWIFRADQAAGKVYLYQKVLGTETERGAVGGIATTLTAGTAVTIEIRCDTQSIWAAVKLGTGVFTAKQTYASASFNQTAAGVKVSGFASGANLASWPNEVALPAPFDYITPESATLQRVSQKTLGWSNIAHDWSGRAVLVALSNGDWIAAYRTGETHTVENAARMHIRISTDEGITWSDEDKLIDGTAIAGTPFEPHHATRGLTDPVLILCPNGDLLLHSYERAIISGNPCAGTSQWRSADDGATWSYEGIINSDVTLVTMDDYKVVGSTLYVISRIDPTGLFNHPQYLDLYKSDDNATGAILTLVSHVEATLDCNEAGLLYAGSNVFRVYVKDTSNLATYRYDSSDLGSTWSARKFITSQIGIINKPKCRTIGAYHWIYGRSINNTNRTVVYRSTDGITLEPRFYPFAEGSEDEDTGYCDILQRANGDFYLLSYSGDTNAASITEAIFQDA